MKKICSLVMSFVMLFSFASGFNFGSITHARAAEQATEDAAIEQTTDAATAEKTAIEENVEDSSDDQWFYLSDFPPMEKVVTGWTTGANYLSINSSIYNTASDSSDAGNIYLCTEKASNADNAVKFEKGMSIHANGKITYDISDMKASRFTCLFGPNPKQKSGLGSVGLLIYTDLNESGEYLYCLNSAADAERLGVEKFPVGQYDKAAEVDIAIPEGATRLYIEVTNGGNGGTNDVAVFAEPKLYADYVYLSDMEYESASTGYGNVLVDKSFNGPIILNTLYQGSANGPSSKKAVTYDKGITAHAASSVTYNIEGLGVKRFTSFCGISTNNGSYDPNTTFKVFFDDVEVYTSTKKKSAANVTIGGNVDLQVPEGTKTITLTTKVASGANSGNHTSWACPRLFCDNLNKVQELSLIVESGGLYLNEAREVTVMGMTLRGERKLESAEVRLTAQSNNITVDGNKVTAIAAGKALLKVEYLEEADVVLSKTFELNVSTESNKISMAGEWQLFLGNYSETVKFIDTCILPGSLEENEKGSFNTKVTTQALNRKYTYTGNAVYQKIISIPDTWANKEIVLTMGRTKNTRVWVNGEEQLNCTSNDSLGTAQKYYLKGIKVGENNTITIQVCNDGYFVTTDSHMLTDHSVTNWNGIIGELSLAAEDQVFIDDVRIYPDIDKNVATVEIDVRNACAATDTIHINYQAVSISDGTKKNLQQADFALTGEEIQEISFEYNMGEDYELWSEFSPNLYDMTIDLSWNENVDSFSQSFGMRKFEAIGNKFAINGTITFLRGEANQAVFPLTGYPFMTKEEWIGFFKEAQALGINFFRWHSWCPPEVAFEAADELGIYMQPELYAFAGYTLHSGVEGRPEYQKAEALRILKELASHPSFVMMAWGNEVYTNTEIGNEFVIQLREMCRAADPTRLYAQGSNNNWKIPSLKEGDDYWTTMWTSADVDHEIRISYAYSNSELGGAICRLEPNTNHTYDSALEGISVPVMNHEAGQYQTLPEFDKQIELFSKGILDPRNLKSFRDLMEQNGLLEMNEIFSKVSSRVSAIGYRADIETALRSNNLAGFQLLSIQDFTGQGTANVGILDAFMNEKNGGFTKEEYKNFNQSIVVLGKMPKLLYKSNETVQLTPVVVNYSQSVLNDVDIYWILKNGSEVIASGELEKATAQQGMANDMGTVAIPLTKVSEAAQLTLIVGSEKANNENSYSIWVYPSEQDTEIPEGVTVSGSFDIATKKVLENGGTVLLLPSPTKSVLPNSVAVRWMTDYWSSMFHRDSTEYGYTMGMYVQDTHPVFNDFPTEYFNDYQWKTLMEGSRAIVMTDLPEEIEPLAWNIDHMQWSRKLGSMFEAKVGEGKIIVCTFDLLDQMENYPEAKQLYRSILNYMASDEFDPTVSITVDQLSSVVSEETIGFDGYSTIEAELYTSQTGTAVKQENGTQEDGSAAVAVGNIQTDTALIYENVYFGSKGAVGVIINGAGKKSANYPQPYVEIYDNNSNELLASLTLDYTSDWVNYKSQTFEIPRLTGVRDIKIVFPAAGYAFNYFRFIESDIQYLNPYDQLDPEMTSENVVIENGDNGSHTMFQNYVAEITNNVSITFNNVDFADHASCEMVLRGRCLNDADASGVIRYVDADGEEQECAFVFKNGKGTAYELSTETFYAQNISIDIITGMQNLELVFNEGTCFDLESITFNKISDPAICEVDGVEYTSVAEAYKVCGEGKYVKLLADVQESFSLTKDLYLDLNGFDLSGSISAGEYKIYGMDSTTDGYSSNDRGYLTCTGIDDAVVVHSQLNGNRYMAISENGWSFHRYYVGITHISLNLASTGIGYKAQFWGTPEVVAQLADTNAFGYILRLEGGNTVSRHLDSVVSGQTVSLRVNNFDVANYSETALYAKVSVTLGGTVVESAEQSVTLRQLVEIINENYTKYTTKLDALAAFVEKYYDTMSTWQIENLYKPQ